MEMSARAAVVAARTYNRPKPDGSLETWADTVDRVLAHQKWLWERAQGHSLSEAQYDELSELGYLMYTRKALPAGRTLWLGGTELSKRREVSQFNCSFLNVETVHDVVDAFWLLLNGCGVGFTPVPGTLNGFAKPLRPEQIEVIRSKRTAKGGSEVNKETFEQGVWTIQVGDSGECWAKAVGKLLAGKYPAKKLVFDLSQIRPPGDRLGQYGWVSAGDEPLAEGLVAMAHLLSARAGRLLTHIDILDVLNWCGYIQTGRRGAEIALYPYGKKGWQDFTSAKKDYWTTGNKQRAQSNNSLVFYDKPNRRQLAEVVGMMVASGGSEPGIINGSAAHERAPFFQGVNPCAEILLGNKAFCNLVEVDLAKFRNNIQDIPRAIRLIARANYRQTCVNLNDGVLQRAWHENNEFLRLCGVGITGIVQVLDVLTPHDFKRLRNVAISATYEMAHELHMPLPQNVTTIKPSGTVSKVMDTTEGIHMPIGKYIINRIVFNKHDPLVAELERAGYEVVDHPTDVSAKIAAFPVKWDHIPFTPKYGLEINMESAVDQLERYKMLMNNYVEHNCSITVNYGPKEVADIVGWLDQNWDTYIGVSFLPRQDNTKTAEQLGYPYLPQTVVSEAEWAKMSRGLKKLRLDPTYVADEIDLGEGCATGVCPVR